MPAAHSWRLQRGPLWVSSGSLAVVTRTSAPGSEADEIGDKADLAFEMSGPGQNQKAPRSQNLTP